MKVSLELITWTFFKMIPFDETQKRNKTAKTIISYFSE
jgi:hypothetical protein